MPDLHLSRKELTEWCGEGAGDRARVITHLAACAACREIAADVERSRPAESGPVRFDAADFAARGYRAGAVGAAPGFAKRWGWLAAAAALVAAVGAPVWLARFDETPGTMRGGATSVELVRPVDVTVSAEKLAFEWNATSPGDRVRLNVMDLDRTGEPLIERDVTGSRYEPSLDERRRFRSGQTVHWYVETLSGPSETSPAARFRVR